MRETSVKNLVTSPTSGVSLTQDPWQLPPTKDPPTNATYAANKFSILWQANFMKLMGLVSLIEHNARFSITVCLSMLGRNLQQNVKCKTKWCTERKRQLSKLKTARLPQLCTVLLSPWNSTATKEKLECQNILPAVYSCLLQKQF